MTMTDPIADLFVRINNANLDEAVTVSIPYSKIKEDIVKIMCERGYLRNYEVAGEGVKKQIVASMKYLSDGTKVLSGLKRVSKPGCRIYSTCEDIKSVRGGLGMTILSTSKGLLTDTQARQNRLGGELLCQVW
jgi:small subunit ribosomal protein S8